jgi:hypothetical protein
MFVRRGDENPCVLRICGRCGEGKPGDEFAWRRKALGQRDNYCRVCRADYKHEHYAKNRQRYIDLAQRRKRAVAAERAAYLIAFFEMHPCVECGEADPVVLEFDHLEGKEFTISQGIRDRSWATVQDEMKKCEVVCANCHRRRTARRAGFARAIAASR